jgi:hypothetical protein
MEWERIFVQTEIYYERRFDMLLRDSIEFLLESVECQSYSFGKTLARGSVIFSLLLLECAANICIEELDLENSINKEVDTLPLLAKFDFYARTRFRNRKFSRGNKYVERVQELKRLRDNFVHPKSLKVELEYEGEDANGWRTSVIQLEKTKLLNVSKNPNYWLAKDAAIVMKAVHDFLGHFFRDICKFSPSRVSALVFSESVLPKSEITAIPALSKVIKRDLVKYQIDLSYLKIVWDN